MRVCVCVDPPQAAGVVWSAVERFIDLGGVRIEDNVVISGDGHYNLTMAADMPKAAADIEEYMAAARTGTTSQLN